MIRWLLIFLSFLAISGSCQKSQIQPINPQPYVNEAARIMKSMGIIIRPNVKLDKDTLSIVYSDTLTGYSAKFQPDTVFIFGDDTASAYYVHPKIYISAFLDSVLRKTKSFPEEINVRVNSILVHEATHYLQEKFNRFKITSSTMNQMSAYLTNPLELPAFFVQAWYFYHHEKQEVAMKIMQDKANNSVQKLYKLLTTFLKEEYLNWR